MGWYTAVSNGTKADTEYRPDSAEVTLYAWWQPDSVVTYNAGAGTCGTSSATYTGTALTLPTTTPQIGWDCTGWYDAPTGGTKVGDEGKAYTPSHPNAESPDAIILYAQYEMIDYKIDYKLEVANWGDAGYVKDQPDDTTAHYGETIVFTIIFGEKTGKDNNDVTVKTESGATVERKKLGYTVNEKNQYVTKFSFDMPAENVVVSINADTCITGVTLADGSQVRVDSLTGNEELLVWNLETGALDTAPVLVIDSDPEAEYEIIHLYFSDGTDVKVIYEHGFWDYDLNEYVYLDRNAADYIGHTFAKHSGDELTKVQLTDVVIETEVTTAWSPVTAGHLVYFVNGMLSLPGGVDGLYNIFEVDPETMTYDPEAMQRDIETYGLYTYEEVNALAPLPEEMFYAVNGQYVKVAVGKGIITEQDLINLINRYVDLFA